MAERVGNDKATLYAFLLGEQSLSTEMANWLADVLGHQWTPVE